MTTDSRFLKDLNAVQQEAVAHFEGPALIIAGAGSGKTRVLTYRIAYLLSQGVPPSSILALTFTNKAAREMKDRIASLVGADLARNLWMGTFHSIFARILRFESECIGFPSNYTIYDTIDAKNLIKSIIKNMDLDTDVYKPNEILGRISSAKNNLITPGAYASNAQIIANDTHSRRPLTLDIYTRYAASCKKAGAMDFDDLLLFTNILFRDFNDVLAKYQDKFKYILVDEYQDTNFSQYLIVKKLAEKHQNVCVVGDDAQSIYSFRGAKIENILNFRNDYPGYKLYKLEQNYRSTKTIVNAANSVIEKNKDQIHKKVWSDKQEGERVKVLRSSTDNEEGYLISNDIVDNQYQTHLKYSDFAILYRTNAQSRIFEEALRRRNVPYRVYGSISFYQRKEIKDILAYYRMVINNNDDEALKRIINYPARGIGDTTLSKIEISADNSNQSMWQVINNANQLIQLGLNKGIIGKLHGFTQKIIEFTSAFATTPAYELAYRIASETGILKDLHNGQTPEERSRFENLEELLNAIKEFTESNTSEGMSPSLDVFMQEVSLLTDADTDKDEDRNKVSLMTIHSAKGLEFEYVYIAGVEEGLFPSQMSANNPKDMEEERRLFYVALTRAKTKATLSFAENRYRWGTLTPASSSRFIRDIDEKYLELPPEHYSAKSGFLSSSDIIDEGPSIIGKNFKKPQNRFAIQNSNRIVPPDFKKKINIPADENFTPDNPEMLQNGMSVQHQRFGNGKIVAMEGAFPNKKATVFFQDIQETKQLLLKFARLKIVK